MSVTLANVSSSRVLRSAQALLTTYARAHRDRRNIQTHLIGVPLNLLAFGLLLARPQWSLGPLAFTPAGMLFAVAAAWYLTRGSLRVGVAASTLVGLLLVAGHQLQVSTGLGVGLAAGVALLLLGTALQMIGHYYEGRRPMSLLDPVHLLVGPMFVAVECAAFFGFLRPIAAEIDRRAGPVHVRDLAHPVAPR